MCDIHDLFISKLKSRVDVCVNALPIPYRWTDTKFGIESDAYLAFDTDACVSPHVRYQIDGQIPNPIDYQHPYTKSDIISKITHSF